MSDTGTCLEETGARVPAWCLDERIHAGHEHLDPPYVAGYDARAGADLDDDLALLRAHGLESETTLVDVDSTFACLLEPMLERAGFEILDASHEGGVYATYVCRAR